MVEDNHRTEMTQKRANKNIRRKVRRKYAEKTIKRLFGLSNNLCAFPDCTNQIIAGETPYSDDEVIGYISHIYAAADNGPRGKPGLTDEEKNSFENLILLCGFHHPIVDKHLDNVPVSYLYWMRDNLKDIRPWLRQA